jgi:hypothetical protein
MAFRAGDTVKHHPSGELWGLIVDEWDGNVVPGGWPQTRARAADCELVELATDEERIKVLKECAASRHEASERAKAQLDGTVVR